MNLPVDHVYLDHLDHVAGDQDHVDRVPMAHDLTDPVVFDPEVLVVVDPMDVDLLLPMVQTDQAV